MTTPGRPGQGNQARIDRLLALGMKRASDLPPRSKPPLPAALEFVDETPKRQRRDDHARVAEDLLGIVWVSVLSLAGPVPVSFTDQRGVLPVWVEANADWRRSGLDFDRQQFAGSARAVRLEVIGVRGDARAERLKAALDLAINGAAALHEADALRHPKRFRNVVDFGGFSEWWPPLLADVVARLELQDNGLELVSRAGHARLVAASLARRTTARARG